MADLKPGAVPSGNGFDVGVVIVSWNTVDLLRRCLSSLMQSSGVAFRACVVDNASTDGSADMVAAAFPGVDLLRQGENLGFSRASNAGLRRLGFAGGKGAPRHALLLNPDTELPPQALAGMVAFLDAHPEAGIAGPRLLRPDGSLDPACRRGFPTPEAAFYRLSGLSRLFPKSSRFGRYNMTFRDPGVTSEVDCVNGAFMMVRGAAIAQVGLLDEEFFFGGEDLDWAYRIKAAGWKVYYHPAVSVLHVKRAAFRKNRGAALEFDRAMWLFYRKHYREHTSVWLDWSIRFGLVLRGGPKLLGIMRNSRAGA